MKLISLNISPEQVRKVRKALPIKINAKHKDMSGQGVSMLVDESTFNNLTRKFDTNKGLLFKLSKTEIDANKDLEKVDDESVKEVMTGNGLFRHKKQAKKAVKKVIDALEGEMKETTGKGIIKSIKKGTKKATKSVAKSTSKVVKDVSKQIKDEAKDLAKDVKNEAEEGLKKTISKIKNQTIKNIPQEAIETVDLIKKSVKAIDKFDPKQIDKIIKSIPKFYRDEIKNTYVGEALREALVVGTDIAVQSAITAMAMNPYTAPLAPLVQASWELGGETGTRMAIEKIGLGLGLGLRASGKGLRASGKGLTASGKGLSASGRGLSASGRGLSASGSGNKPEMIKHKINPFYLENKLTNQPTDKQKIVKQTTHEDKLIVGAGGGHHISGLFLQAPVMSGILKPRPLKRVSMLEGKHQ